MHRGPQSGSSDLSDINLTIDQRRSSTDIELAEASIPKQMMHFSLFQIIPLFQNIFESLRKNFPFLTFSKKILFYPQKLFMTFLSHLL